MPEKIVTPDGPQQPVTASVDGWTVSSASVNPPTEAQLIERLGGEAKAAEPTAEEAAAVEAEAAARVPAAEEVPAAVAVEGAEVVAEVPAGEQPKPGAAKAPKKGSPEYRIGVATAKQRDAERREADARAENDRLKAELAAHQAPAKSEAAIAPAAAAKPDATPRPTWAAMEAEGKTYDEYLEARDTWVEKNILEVAKAEAAAIVRTAQDAQRDASNTELRNRVNARILADHQTRLEEERKVTPNFDELVSAHDDIPLPQWMQNSIRRSTLGPKVMLYLNAHTDEWESIAQMHPIAGIEELGIIQGMLKREIAAQSGPASLSPSRTSARPPTRPVAGSPVAASTPAAASTNDFNADWVREENERERQTRMRRV